MPLNALQTTTTIILTSTLTRHVLVVDDVQAKEVP